MVVFPDSDAPRKDELVYGADEDKSTIPRSMTLRDRQLAFSFSVGLSSSSGVFELALDTHVAEETQLPILWLWLWLQLRFVVVGLWSYSGTGKSSFGAVRTFRHDTHQRPSRLIKTLNCRYIGYNT